MKKILVLIAILFAGENFAQTLNQITVNGSAAGPQLQPLWRDHYDLSINHSALSSLPPFSADPNFIPTMNELQPRYWRCSIGRWEVGYESPVNGTGSDTTLL